MSNFNGKNVIITGAADGIGKSLALKLNQQGAKVIATDINEEKLALLAGLTNGSVVCEPLDVTDADAVELLFKEVKEQLGQIDYVFNNAGIAVTGDCRDISLDQWRKVTDVNQWGVIHGAMAAYQIMAGQGNGHIINAQ